MRQACILGHQNVDELKQVPHLFANEFYEDVDPEAYDELERWYMDRIHAEWLNAPKPLLNVSFTPAPYAYLQCSKYHLP